MAEGKKVKIETYDTSEWERQGSRKIAASVNEFGVEQNRFNKAMVNRLRRTENETRNLGADVQELNDNLQQQFAQYDEVIETMKKEYDEIVSTLRKENDEMKEQISDLKKECDRLRLTAKLNSGSIEKIMKLLPGSIDVDIE